MSLEHLTKKIRKSMGARKDLLVKNSNKRKCDDGQIRKPGSGWKPRGILMLRNQARESFQVGTLWCQFIEVTKDTYSTLSLSTKDKTNEIL